MAWSFDDEDRTRATMRRVAPLRLREPVIAFGPAALGLMYAVGLLAGAWVLTSLFESAAKLGGLALAAGLGTAASAGLIGPKLRRFEETSATPMVTRSTLAWATVGGLAALWTEVSGVMAQQTRPEDFGEIVLLVITVSGDTLAGAIAGAVGGFAGALAATLLCIERAD